MGELYGGIKKEGNRIFPAQCLLYNEYKFHVVNV